MTGLWFSQKGGGNMAEWAKEAGHYYWPDGRPCYEVPKRGGGVRPTTIRDARKFGLFPSVSLIIGQLDKPGLNQYRVNQAILSAATIPRVEGESADAFAARVKEDAEAQMVSARDLGTLVHGWLESWFRGDPVPDEAVSWVDAVKERIAGEVEEAERSFACVLDGYGYGGKTDLVTSEFVYDFKTQEFSGKPSVWEGHKLQIAAYSHALGRPGRLLYISTTTKESRVVDVNVDKYLDMFRLLLPLFYKRKGLANGIREVT